MPDVWQLGNTWVPQFVSLNALENLDPWIKGSAALKKENYFEGIWNTNEIEGKIYGVPWYVDTRVLFYRTDVVKEAGFDAPPKTWDELLRLCRNIKAKSGDSEKYAIYMPTNEWASFAIFALQNGAPMLKDNNSYGDFSNPKFKEAFGFCINLIDEKLAPLGFSQVTNVYQAFADKYFALYISGPWNVTEFKRWMKGNLKDKWMTAPLPGKEASKPGLSLAGGSSLVMSAKSEHKKDAWKLIEFLSRSDIQLEFYREASDLPAVKKAWDDSSLANNIYMKAFYKQFDFVAPTPKVTEWEQIAFSKIQQYAEATAGKSMSLDNALKALDADVNKILEKRRWLLKKNKIKS